MSTVSPAIADQIKSTPSPAVMGTYGRQNVVFERGEGCWLFDTNGERYLDFCSGVSVNSLGHADPELVSVLNEQAQKLWHTSNLFRISTQEALAERLCELTFADAVFFCNSGAEACEGAIKMARRYHFVNGNPERNRIITFSGAFHGRTLATIAAAGNAKHLEGFAPEMPGFDHVPFGDDVALEAAIGPETAAIMVEPVQGEGGLDVLSKPQLERLRQLCDDNGLLLIFDEVQSGTGRTGRLFAHEWSDAKPDVMAIAKGIGGGFPLGAFMGTSEAAKGMTPGTHGSTYGGNLLATAVGLAVLNRVAQPEFLAHVEDVSLRFRQHLAELQDAYPDVIEDIRGKGLLTGIKVKPPAGDVVNACMDERLLTVIAGNNVVRLVPPLIVSAEEVGQAAERLRAACERVRQQAN